MENENGSWQTIVRHKYLRNKTIGEVKHRLGDSTIWTDLLKVKNIYLQGRSIKIGNGELTSSWNDVFLFDKPLSATAPVLYELCESKEVTVAQFRRGMKITFRRWLPEDLRTCWDKICADISTFQFSDISNSVIWMLEGKGILSVKSVYNALSKSEIGTYHKRIWKGRIPPKIKIFLWLLSNDAILTKENLKKRKWQGDPNCVFCDSLETTDHLFFQCPHC